jgi:hypothetical protein
MEAKVSRLKKRAPIFLVESFSFSPTRSLDGML